MIHRLYLPTMIALVTWFGHSYGGTPRYGPLQESVDLIELNHFYDEQGRLVFDQVIFYDWSSRDARYMVRAWRLVKSPDQLPRRDWQRGGYVTTFRDDQEGCQMVRLIRSDAIRETWLQYDPELLEREVLPKEQRLELAKR